MLFFHFFMRVRPLRFVAVVWNGLCAGGED